MLIIGIGGANALEVAPYLESSTHARPSSGVGVSLQEDGLRLRAGLKLEVDGDSTKTLPHLSSAFAFGGRLDVQTSLNLPDWNSGIDFGHASFDSRFRLRSPVPSVERLDMRIRRTAKGVSHDTSVQFRSPVSFLNQVEGRVRQSPSGNSRYSLKLGFSERLNAASAETPLTIRGRATLEQMASPHRPDTILLGMETVLSGIVPRDSNGVPPKWRSTSSNRLVFRFERRAGAHERYTSSLAYDHSWDIRDLTEIELRLKVDEIADDLSPSLKLTWQTQF